MIGRSQYGFLKAKYCLKNLTGFYDEMTGLVDEEWILFILILA